MVYLSKNYAIIAAIKATKDPFTSSQIFNTVQNLYPELKILKKNVTCYLWELKQKNSLMIIEPHTLIHQPAIYRRIKDCTENLHFDRFYAVRKTIKLLKGSLNCLEIQKKLKELYPSIHVPQHYINKRLKKIKEERNDVSLNKSNINVLKYVINQINEDFTVDTVKEKLISDFPDSLISLDYLICQLADFVTRGFIERIQDHKIVHSEAEYIKNIDFDVSHIKKSKKRIRVTPTLNNSISSILEKKHEYKIKLEDAEDSWHSFYEASYKNALIAYTKNIPTSDFLTIAEKKVMVKNKFNVIRIYKLIPQFNIQEIECLM